MSVHRFTDRWIKAQSAPADTRLEYADALCPGLHLRVTGKGTKTFAAMVRVRGRLQRRTLGRYPQVSLADARAATLELLRQVAGGLDPREDARKAEQGLTYAELVDLYTERHLRPNCRSWRDIRGSLLHPALARLQTMRAAQICKADIIGLIDELAATRPQAGVNVLRRLKMAFGWALDRDLLASNPCDRIRPPAKTNERDRVLSDEEIAAVWQASFKLPPPYGQMYRMFLLTGQRRSEIATMKWNEVAGDLWIIPAEKVKMSRAHAVPLSATAVATLAELPCYGQNAFVFSTTGGRSASSNFHKVKDEMDRLSGVSAWRIHDIRRTVRTKLAELGISREVARRVVNHQDGKIDRTYDRHAYLEEKRDALTRWENNLLKISRRDCPGI